jgi:hypothetical protein
MTTHTLPFDQEQNPHTENKRDQFQYLWFCVRYEILVGLGQWPFHTPRMRNSLQNILGLVNNLDAHLFRPAIRFAEVRQTFRSCLASHGSNNETVCGHSRQLHKHLWTLRTAERRPRVRNCDNHEHPNHKQLSPFACRTPVPTTTNVTPVINNI